jgi:basic amino acid/polyamine antiporter, APA family
VNERQPELVRGLSTFDGTLLTIGAIVGTGIFFTTHEMARELPDATAILCVWLAAGLMTLAGALTYAELGAMFPGAGGLYRFLERAYGPLPGFLYGWTAFTVIMSGGIAAIAVGFGEYLGVFVPFFAKENVLLSLGDGAWTVSGSQIAAALGIVVLTALNAIGLQEGKWTQNLLTLVKALAIVAFAVVAFAVPGGTGSRSRPAR